MENNEINEEILNLWKKYKGQKGTEVYPLLYPKFNVDCDILFIGINPSLNEKKREYFKFENKNFNEQEAIDGERYAKDESHEKKYSRYFKPIWKIVGTNITWEHIDVFLIREGTQKKLDLGYEEDKAKFNEFGEAQFNLFLKIINKINPKIIVVINKFASDIIKSKLKNRITGNFEEEGFDKVSIKEGNNVPIIFTGYMGSGRLDNYSLRTLTWIIKRALNSV